MATPAKVYLLGAGPGDPELVTERARRRLAEADVVLYDALVHADVLRLCKPGAQLVPAPEQQVELAARVVLEASAGRVVARLRVGDGCSARDSEEAEHLAESGLAFEIVPGVSEPSAVAAYAGIALAHGKLSSSIALLGDEDGAQDWGKLATSTQTLVVHLGTRDLDSLMRRLVVHGRAASTPAAVVQWVSLPAQRVVVGTVGTIAGLAHGAGLGRPALAVVGDVVTLRATLDWYEGQPLFGRRVLVTRTERQADRMAELLRDAGAEPVRSPTIRLAPADDTARVARAAAEVGSYDWVVLTSANGVEAFFGALARSGHDARALGRARVCAIGPGTAAALAREGVRADVVPEEFRGEAAAAAILAAHGGPVTGARVLLPRAAVARDVLPETLRAAGALVDVVAVYRTLPPPEADLARLRALCAAREIDVVTFTSSSTVDNLVSALGDDARRLLEPLVVASIGPITTDTARRHGLTVAVTATEYTIDGLVAALTRHFAENR